MHVKAHAHLFHSPLLTPLPSLSWTLQDGGWVKEDEESEVNRGNKKPRAWFRCLSILGCAAAQLSGQTATASFCQLERLEPHSLRHLGSPAVFHTCELASLPGYCWLWSLFSAEAMLAHNVSPRTVTKACVRRHSCFVAVRLCLTPEGSHFRTPGNGVQVKRGMPATGAGPATVAGAGQQLFHRGIPPCAKAHGRSTKPFEEVWGERIALVACQFDLFEPSCAQVFDAVC